MDGKFFVVKSEERTGKAKPYMDLILRWPTATKNDDISAKIWDAQSLKYKPEVGDYIGAVYKEDSFNGKPQLILQAVAKAVAKAEDFLPQPSVPDPEASYQQLFLKGWTDPVFESFFQSVDKYLHDKKIEGVTAYEVLLSIPAGSRNHHPGRAGLLLHLTEMQAAATLLCQEVTDLPVNKDLLRAAILLHDLGKIMEYSPTTYEHIDTMEGNLVGHVTWSSFIVQHFFKGTSAQSWHLIHCLLAHHGDLAFGSPVKPATVEAHILCTVDKFSASMNCFRRALKLHEKGEKLDRYKSLGDTTPVFRPL
jgi:3'-5' exoribonuclease